jgi:hypothetical protein
LRRDIILVFASCAFPIYSWSFLWFFQKMPSWLQFLNLWDNVSIVAYIQAFALLESLLVLLLLIVLGFLLPAPFFRDKFAAQGSVTVFVASCWAVVFQSLRGEVRAWSLGESLFWFALSLLTIGVSCVMIYRLECLERAVGAFAERLTVLLYLYVPLSLVGLIVVAARNILGSG